MTAAQRAATSLTVDSDLGDLPSTLLAPEGRGRIAAAVIERSVPVPRQRGVEIAPADTFRTVVHVEQERPKRRSRHCCPDPSCAVNCEAAGHFTGPYQYHPRRRSLLSRT